MFDVSFIRTVVKLHEFFAVTVLDLVLLLTPYHTRNLILIGDAKIINFEVV